MGTGRWLPLLAGLLLSGSVSLADEATVERELKELNDQLLKLHSTSKVKPDALADAEVFAKGITWALRYDKRFEPVDQTLLKKAVARCKERIAALESGKQP